MLVSLMISENPAVRDTLDVRRWLKRQLVLALAALLVASGSGCRRDPHQLAVLTPTTGTMIWDAVHTGAVLEGRQCGLQVHYDGPPREDDLRQQLAIFEKALKEHYGVIAIAPIQMQALRNPVQRASTSGIPVIVIGEDLGIRRPNIAYVLTDEEMGGKLAADKLGEELHGNGNVAVIGMDFNQPRSVERDRAFEQELSDRFKNINIVTRRTGTANLFQEQQTADELLSQPDNIHGIVALSAAATRGAFYALKARNLHSRLHLIGFDQDLVVPLVNGNMDAIIGVRASDIGRTVARLACDRMDGKAWVGPYVLSPVVLSPETFGRADVEQQLHGGGWWKGEQ